MAEPCARLPATGHPLSLSEMAELLGQFPPAAPKRLHAHPVAVEALVSLATPAAPALWAGSISALIGIPVISDDTMEPEAWEIREGDKVVASGVVRFGGAAA